MTDVDTSMKHHVPVYHVYKSIVLVTPLKINVSPEKGPFEKDISSSKPSHSWLQHVHFPGCTIQIQTLYFWNPAPKK